MDETEKMSGAEYVNAMADLGIKHGKMMIEIMDTIQKELDEAHSEDATKDIHPIFVSAGEGAYVGALRIHLSNKARIFEVIFPKN